MSRETAAQRKSRIAMLLAAYDARSRELNKVTAEVKTLKEQVREISGGTYGEWTLAYGNPREIVDQAAVKAAYSARAEELPRKQTEAPIVVTHTAK